MSIHSFWVRAFSLAVMTTACFGTAGASGSDVEKGSEQGFETSVGGVYSPGGWSTLHRGPANRKLVPSVPLADEYESWTVLAGASVLTAPTMSPDGRTLYVTTGRARGESNLHAFSLDGEPRWTSEPWSSAEEGIDPCAILSSPIVDLDGDIFIGDCNQLFAYSPSGELKWVADLPEPRDGDWVVAEELPVNALTTAAFTREGHVFGVTNFGDVVVFDRATGQQLNRSMRLPGHVPPASSVMPMPPSIFGDGLIDPLIREWAWQLLVGGAMPSANTPAVDLSTGRVFVAATSTAEGKGALYGLDLVSRGGGVEVEIAFVTEMGPGSGSSPSLSPSSHRVYVSDETGRFYGVDAESGEIHWEVETRATSAAAAVGANGDIYTLQAYGPALIAMSEEGEVRWESDLQALADEALPEGWILGAPVAIGNGNPTVLDDVVLVPVVYGYETTIGRNIPWPVRSSLVAVDAKTGRGVGDVLDLEDDSTGITAVLPDGTILNSLGTAMTSGVTPLASVARWLLPADLEPLLPVGGLQVSRPIGLPNPVVGPGLAAALAARGAEDRSADGHRRPAEVLAFAGIEKGMRIADLMAGAGWYSEVLARAVGPTGQVVAQNNALSSSRYGGALKDRIGEASLSQVELLEVELDALALAPGTFDAVFLIQFYHDTVWMGVDRAEMNRRIFEALEPGGVFVVVDHQAVEGAGIEPVKELHRIEVSVVQKEIEAAGFRLSEQSALLAHPLDDRTINVFDPRIRGQTDRFLLRFEKPRAAE
jgi:predicted methyltransferase/outer membrane protein assembly factor BamB